MKNMTMILLITSSLVIMALTNGCEKDLLLEVNSSYTTSLATAATYYVSPSGSDSNPGTITRPFKNWDKVLDVIKPGDLVYLRGGTYYPSSRSKSAACYLVGKSGIAGSYIKIWAYPGEKPILDCQSLATISGVVGMRLVGNYWHIKGIEIKNVRQSINPSTGKGTDNAGFAISNSSNNILENIKVHDIGGIGCSISGTSTKNVLKNCDFYNNYDKYSYNSTGVLSPGGNADGMHITVVKGTSNIVKGCRFFNNSDDGLDLWQNEGTMIIDSCWAYRNGYAKGDGNGFKLGRTLLTKESFPQRLIYHSIAYGNKKHGFDQNGANVTMVFYNNVAYKNQGLGFNISKYYLKNVFKNNFSNLNGYRDGITIESVSQNNSWNSIPISTSNFLSINSAELDFVRKVNGSLPTINLLVPVSTGVLVDKGLVVGFPYKGKMPDIGVFETKL